MNVSPSLVFGIVFLSLAGSLVAETIEAEVCVYGGTSAGVIAAAQAARMGHTAVVVEFGRHLGGLTTGGLGATDIGNKAAVGGLSRDFYGRIARHYARDAAWQFETRADYFVRRGSGQSKASDLTSSNATMWTFEPRVAEEIFREIAREAKTPVYYEQRLTAVKKVGARITEITMANGNVFRAKVFIDASYEGDLMARAGVAYHVGREANAVYGETLNGIRAQTPHHQFTVPVDPYVKPGEPSSGLLPFIQPGDGGKPGDGDRRVQAYNFRLCFTTNTANRRPIAPPSKYDPARYELLARYFEALVAAGKKPQLKEFWNPIWMPNGKTDINNNGGFSTDFIGANYDYAEADDATRAQVWQEHEDYTRGFLTFLATSPRVPANIRAEMQTWGPARDEFTDTGGWPNQLYVREARRLISDYVMTEKNCRGQEVVSDSVGLAAYNMDSHNCQRIVKNGRVENEGDVQVPPMKPYPISYRSLVPKAAECENLFVPVCLAASHIAYGSIRMEPVFMILGQSAATAASFAIDEKIAVQKVNYAKLREQLVKDGQILAWDGTSSDGGNPRTETPAPKLDGLVLDDADAVKTGEWTAGTLTESRRIGTGYIHDGNANKGGSTVRWTPDIPAAGEYEIVLHFPPNPNRATNAPVTIEMPGAAPRTVKVNQQEKSGRASLGAFRLPSGKGTAITLSNRDTDGYVIADGVQLLAK